ncbi:pyridoxamine 5'-phosphate oxidase family protein [Nocardia vaccinii]|uniref:pyridoxamine 5'-phosphate oxidase family protein n=1 Tax=Nocardia vaccinii TaxID=1822 RepID=UPI000832A8E2|nr:pyridoxamine 5'-phosphate oxidase family protein [Nocardia vaccinii]
MSSDAEDGQLKEVLSVDDCWDLLASEQLGRLITIAGGRPEIFPVNYGISGRAVYFKSAEGSKLASVAVAPKVAFEVDHRADRVAWSVVIHGAARLVQSFGEMAALDELGITPWELGGKYNYVAITADEITGRRLFRTD